MVHQPSYTVPQVVHQPAPMIVQHVPSVPVVPPRISVPVVHPQRPTQPIVQPQYQLHPQYQQHYQPQYPNHGTVNSVAHAAASAGAKSNYNEGLVSQPELVGNYNDGHTTGYDSSSYTGHGSDHDVRYDAGYVNPASYSNANTNANAFANANGNANANAFANANANGNANANAFANANANANANAYASANANANANGGGFNNDDGFGLVFLVL